MSRNHEQKIEMIPIDMINVLNPRARNKKTHLEIINNIGKIGLKRPIKVSRRSTNRYDLVCGEGRVEAFRLLGETMIPAIVIEAPEADCFVMSLIENVARRQHRAIDIMHEIGSLHQRGYSDAAIATKIGVTTSWVNMVVTLLSNGEERLVSAVETGLIPIGLAIDIARADHTEVQNVLMDAYAAGKIKGKKLGIIRRMLDQRMKRSKSINDNSLGKKNPPRKITTTDLMRLYQGEAEKQRVLIKKSDYTQSKLLFIVEALKDLLSNEGFTTLLRAERLETMPHALAARITGKVL